MKKKNWFVNNKDYTANTFIGGVSATVTSASVLATRLNYYPIGGTLSVNDIKSFEIIGNDIQFYIGVDYSIDDNGFIDERTFITEYTDTDGYCKKVQFRGFYNSYNQLQKIWMPSCIEIEEQSFNNNLIGTNDMVEFYMPNLQIIGDDVGRNRLWEGSSLLGVSVFTVNSFLQTCNGGGIEGDIAWLISNGNTVNFITT